MNREQLKEARHIAQDRAQLLWERTSDVAPERRPFVALERAIRAYGRVAAYAHKHCETSDAQEAIEVASSFYTRVLERLAFAQAAAVPLRIWLCQTRFSPKISDSINYAHGLYIARMNPSLHDFSPADFEMLRHVRDETRLLSVLSKTFERSVRALATQYIQTFATCHPHALMSFLVGYRRRFELEVLVGQDLSHASLPLIPYHAKYTLDLLEDLIYFMSGENRLLIPLHPYISFVPEANYARIDITTAELMTPTFWEAVRSDLERNSKAAQYLLEWGVYIEPLAWDQGYGQGVSVRLPWVKA